MWSVVAWVILGELLIVFITLAVAHDSDRVPALVINNAAMYVVGILIGWWLL
jgi:hypothetical protein